MEAIFVALPMASQPRILKLLEELRDTTASIYFVPDMFLTDLIQARMDDINGMPVVAVCETPFYGVNGLVKRLEDLVLVIADPGRDLAAAARDRGRGEAHLARPGDLPAAPVRSRRQGDRRLQVPHDARHGGRDRAYRRRRRTTRG